MKTSNEILTDIYNIVALSPIGLLSGGIYKKTRPTGSTLEDCVISLISGGTGKFLQDGAIYIKIYYLDEFQDNSWYEDTSNGGVLEALLIALSKTLLSTNGYSFDVESRETMIEAVENIHQHYAILKMNFEVTND